MMLKKPKKKGGGAKKKAKKMLVREQEEEEAEEADDAHDHDDVEVGLLLLSHCSASLMLPQSRGELKKTKLPEPEPELAIDPDDPNLTAPLPRYNAMLAVLRNTLYMYCPLHLP